MTFSAARHGAWRHAGRAGDGCRRGLPQRRIVRRGLSASAQNQALCALVFLYGRLLEDVIAQDHLGKIFAALTAAARVIDLYV